MSLHSYLKDGPHILKPETGHKIWEAFGKTISDKMCPSISVNVCFLERPETAPPELVAATREFSFWEDFYAEGRLKERRTGEYRLRTARASITVAERFKHKLRVSGPDLADMAELHSKIRGGTIAPHIPYEEEQVKGRLVGFREAFAQLVMAGLRALGCRAV